MNKKNWIWLVVVIVVVIAGVFIYKSQNKETSEQNVIKIGAILPLTGKLSIIGKPEQDAIYIYQNNNDNFKVIIEDFASEPKNVLSAFSKLKNIEKINIYYTSTSPSCNVLKPEIINEKLFLIGNTSQKGVAMLTRNIFQIAPITEDEIKLVSDSVIFEKSAELLIPNNELGNNMRECFIKNNPNITFNIQNFNVGEKDFKNLITKFEPTNKVIIFQGYPADIPVFLKQLQELKVRAVEKVVLPMSAVWIPLDTYQNKPFKIVFPLPSIYKNYVQGNTKDFNPKLKKYIEEFKYQFKKDINYDVLFVWQALEIMEKSAINSREKGTTFAAEFQLIWSKGMFNGLLGEVSLNGNGDIFVPMSLLEFDSKN